MILWMGIDLMNVVEWNHEWDIDFILSEKFLGACTHVFFDGTLIS